MSKRGLFLGVLTTTTTRLVVRALSSSSCARQRFCTRNGMRRFASIPLHDGSRHLPPMVQTDGAHVASLLRLSSSLRAATVCSPPRFARAQAVTLACPSSRVAWCVLPTRTRCGSGAFSLFSLSFFRDDSFESAEFCRYVRFGLDAADPDPSWARVWPTVPRGVAPNDVFFVIALRTARCGAQYWF